MNVQRFLGVTVAPVLLFAAAGCSASGATPGTAAEVPDPAPAASTAAVTTMPAYPDDPHSYAHPGSARVTHRPGIGTAGPRR